MDWHLLMLVVVDKRARPCRAEEILSSLPPLLPPPPLHSHDGSGIWTCYGEPSSRWYLTMQTLSYVVFGQSCFITSRISIGVELVQLPAGLSWHCNLVTVLANSSSASKKAALLFCHHPPTIPSQKQQEFCYPLQPQKRLPNCLWSRGIFLFAAGDGSWIWPAVAFYKKNQKKRRPRVGTTMGCGTHMWDGICAFPRTDTGFSLPSWYGLNCQKVCQPQNMASSAKTAKVTPVGPKKCRKITKNFLGKVRNFSVLDKGDCQTAWVFAHWGPCIGCQRRAWPHAADSPHFHVQRGKIGQFFEVWVFPGINAGLCVDSPQNTTRDLQNTPGTPAVHFPLVAAGSQSAL